MTDLVAALAATKPFLDERLYQNFAKATQTIIDGLAAKSIPNARLNDAKFYIGRGIDKAVDGYLSWDKVPAYPYVLVSGPTNINSALKEATKNGWTDYVAFLTAILPYAAAMKEIKGYAVKRQDAPPAPLTPEQEARQAATMTCQCCGHKYLANTGTMAHHGYQRPGGGWQTASCMGAKYLPFEVDRSRLADLIVILKQWEERRVNHIAKVTCEAIGIDRNYTKGYGKNEVKVEVTYTRANFEEMRDLHNGRGGLSYSIYSFDDLKEQELAGLNRELEFLRQDIATQEGRYAGWKQTHNWENNAKAWLAVA